MQNAIIKQASASASTHSCTRYRDVAMSPRAAGDPAASAAMVAIAKEGKTSQQQQRGLAVSNAEAPAEATLGATAAIPPVRISVASDDDEPESVLGSGLETNKSSTDADKDSNGTAPSEDEDLLRPAPVEAGATEAEIIVAAGEHTVPLSDYGIPNSGPAEPTAMASSTGEGDGNGLTVDSTDEGVVGGGPTSGFVQLTPTTTAGVGSSDSTTEPPTDARAVTPGSPTEVVINGIIVEVCG